MQSLLQNLPIETVQREYIDPSAAGELASGYAQVTSFRRFRHWLGDIDFLGVANDKPRLGTSRQKVDAYRNNPQQLAASYQKSQRLVDLLALQKLKSQRCGRPRHANESAKRPKHNETAARTRNVSAH